MINSPILDTCCGGKMFYFDKHDDRGLFQDIRKMETTLCDGRHFEVNPDVQADFTNMPYPDNSFRMVVFDPPHLLRSIENCKTCDIYNEPSPKNKVTGYQMIKYVKGYLFNVLKDVGDDEYIATYLRNKGYKVEGNIE